MADEKNRNNLLTQAAAAAAAAAPAVPLPPVVKVTPAPAPAATIPAAATASFNNILEAASLDRRRVKDLKEVNDTLSGLASDPSFQQGTVDRPPISNMSYQKHLPYHFTSLML